jgi:hypothetical protein
MPSLARQLRRIPVALHATVLLCHCAGPVAGARATPTARAAAGERRRLPVPDHGALEITVPPGWTVRTAEGEPGWPTAVRLDAPGGGALFLSPLWNPEGPGEAPVLDSARFFAELARRKALASSAEHELPLRTLLGRDGELVGFWFSATDREWAPPGPGQERWRNLLRGAAAVGRLLLPFTWLDDEPGPEREVVIGLVRDARHVGQPDEPSAGPEPLRFTPDPGASTVPLRVEAPGGAFTVLVDLPGFEMYAPRPSPAGAGVIVLGQHPATGLVASVTIRTAGGAVDGRRCRDEKLEAMRRSAPDLAGLRTFERDGLARASYVLPELRGREIRQEHAHAFLARPGWCVDVQVSKADPEAGDAARMEAVLRSARLAESL